MANHGLREKCHLIVSKLLKKSRKNSIFIQGDVLVFLTSSLHTCANVEHLPLDGLNTSVTMIDIYYG